MAKISLSKGFYFQYDHRFLFSRETGTLEHVKRYVWKNSLNLDCQDSISFGIFQVA